MQHKPEIFDIPLHDIKPLIDVPEYSLYYLIVTVIVGVILFTLLIFALIRFIKNRNKFSLRKEHLKLLNAVEFSDAKKAAYDITYYAQSFQNDSLEHQEAYEHLQNNLETYKYRKNVDSFDEETKTSLKNYMALLHV
ncbi:hypothetical protein [Sulfurimonas sp.]|jgi:hypothetical protein|uniref:hypothetical protein n=1 Tax=Sulfurimonas sp. TaxID=2022749 RepID=UPI0025EBE3C1|nr:hypothetical protein [Sulfurimonas sp.]MBT5934373.1 hypothetical protein [Sulfurimonas sp.]